MTVIVQAHSNDFFFLPLKLLSFSKLRLNEDSTEKDADGGSEGAK